LVTSISFRIYPLPEASSFCELLFDQAESLDKFLAALRSSILLPSAVVITHSFGGASSLSFRGVIGFEGQGQAVDRQNKELLQMAGNFGGKGESHVGRDAMVKILGTAIDPDETPQNLLTVKISVPIAKGVRTFEAIRKLAAGGPLALKSALLGGNGIIFLNACPSSQDAAVRLIGGLKEIVQSADGYMTPVRAHRNLLGLWGGRAESTLHRLVLQPIKEKVDPTGVFPPII
jgi:hypothetical protein